MSKRLIKKLFFVATTGVLLGAALALWRPWNSPARKVASEETLSAPTPKLWAHSPNGKMMRSSHIVIEAPQGVPEKPDQELFLKARINVYQAPDAGLSYRWILPDHARLFEGQLEDTLSGVQAFQTVELEISVVGLTSEEAAAISLNVIGQYAGQELVSAGSFSTRPMNLQVITEEKKQVLEEMSSPGREFKAE
jgi:hypothetical protein